MLWLLYGRHMYLERFSNNLEIIMRTHDQKLELEGSKLIGLANGDKRARLLVALANTQSKAKQTT